MVNKTAKYYIAYMDILGYKDYLKNKPEETERYLQTVLSVVDKLKEGVSYFQTVVTDMFRIESGLKLRIFSDNILLCLPVKKGKDEIRRAIAFLISVASIQRGMMMEHKLLVRGGITIGEMYINEDIVFGQGLIDAVSLESKAEYPCIVISDEIQDYLKGLLHNVTDQYEMTKTILQKKKRKEQLTEEEENYLSVNMDMVVREVYYAQSLKEILRHYDDELTFLNYLFDLSFNTLLGYEFAAFVNKVAAEEPEKYKGIVETTDMIYTILLAHKEVLTKMINDNCHYNDVDKTDQIAVTNREKVIRKYIWLLRYHNSMCLERKFQIGLFAHQYGCDQKVLRLILRADV